MIRKLAVAILLEKCFGIQWELYVPGLSAPPCWYHMVVTATADDLVMLMNLCAEAGARADLLFLNGVLAELLALNTANQVCKA